jgi:DnaJ like chaperone protein
LDICGEAGRLHVAGQRFDGLERYATGESDGMPGPRLRHLAGFLRELPGGLARMRSLGDYGDSYRGMWQHAVDAIGDGAQAGCSLEDGREAMRRFSLGAAEVQRAIGFFTAGKAADYPLAGVLGALRDATAGREDLRRLFVQIQLEAALRGGGLGAPARGVFARLCSALDITAIEFAALEAMLRMRGFAAAAGSARGEAERLADAYQVLGVAPGAGDAEVTLAYRRLVSRNHPDKLVASGLPQSMVEAAHERTRRILEAYEIIRKHRGMK